MGSVTDEISSKHSKDLITRKSTNKTIHIKSNEITYSENIINFDPIKRSDVLKQKIIENPKIGVIDLETYNHTVNGYSMVYAAGLYFNGLDKPFILYINKNTLDSNLLIFNLINEMFKYKGILWYCHNFGHFDSPFILKVLIDYNKTDEGKINPFKLDPVFKDNSLLKIKIGKKIKNNTVYIIIVDSYNLLPNSLNKLGKSFSVEVQKGIFPYKFSTQNNLFYIGQTPDIHFYEDINILEYNKLYIQNWSFKDETIYYLENDLNCLHQVITTAK